MPTDAKDLIHSGCHDKPRYSFNKTLAAPHHLSWLWPWQILGLLSGPTFRSCNAFWALTPPPLGSVLQHSSQSTGTLCKSLNDIDGG